MKASLARRLVLVSLLALVGAGAARAAAAGGGTVIYEGGFDAADLAWQQDVGGARFPALAGLRGLDEPGRW